ncbi:MAG TPA: nicotinamide riboside transporter PnuC [Steroidobacteraceae bacterium]
MTVVDHVVAALAQVALVEWVAVVLALGYLVLAIRQNPWCWACAIASALLYLVIFARAGLAMQALLQVFYVAMSVYGWRTWGAPGSATALRVTWWTARRHLAALALVCAVSALNGAFMAREGGSTWVPYVDAVIAWGSVLATWMVARKVLENWLYWVVLDLAAAGLYWTQGLYATAVLFVVYAVLALRGYQEWLRDARRQPATA